MPSMSDENGKEKTGDEAEESAEKGEHARETTEEIIPMVAAVLEADTQQESPPSVVATAQHTTSSIVTSAGERIPTQVHPLQHEHSTDTVPSTSAIETCDDEIPMVSAVAAEHAGYPIAMSTQAMHSHASSRAPTQPISTSISQPVRMLTVLSPATLPEGYEFEVQFHNNSNNASNGGQSAQQIGEVLVTVPRGGVVTGQLFQVPYPIHEESIWQEHPQAQMPLSVPKVVPIQGHWRKAPCEDCCEMVSTGIFWQALCLTPILLGQLAQRMQLDPCGNPIDDFGTEDNDSDNESSRHRRRHSNTCQTISLIFSIYFALLWIAVGLFFWPAAFVYMVILAAKVRFQYRQYYKIGRVTHGSSPNRTRGTSSEDICCALCCTACISLQMARHTHDETIYPYQCCTETGLPLHAPLPEMEEA